MQSIRLMTVAAMVAGLVTMTGPAGGAQVPTCFGSPATIIASPGVPTVGTSGPDVIVGTAGDDVIRARGGRDKVCAKGGDDRVWGGRGRDMISLGPGDDIARGGSGGDLIKGNSGRDRIWGNNGPDVLNGGRGFDVLIGGKKDDDLFGRRGADDLQGNSGDDQLRGGTSIDICSGGSGTNTVSSCNELLPFGPNPFVGWWTAGPLPGTVVTLSIDPAGNAIGFADFDPGCGGSLRWTTRGRQTAASTWTPTSDFVGTCESGLQTVNPAPQGWTATYDAATDTMRYGGAQTCYWRHGADPAGCAA